MKSEISKQTIKSERMKSRLIATYQGKSYKSTYYDLTSGWKKLLSTFKNMVENETRPNQQS